MLRHLVCTTLFAVALVSSAAATDFTVSLNQPDGSPFLDQAGKPLDFNLEIAARNVLLSDIVGEPAKPDEKAKAFALWQKITKDPKNVTLTTEDVQLLKERTGKMYNPWVYGNMLQLIAPNDLPKE